MITAFLVVAVVSRLKEVIELAVCGLPGHDIICDWEAETPAGGSVCMRLKSRIRRLLAAVDMLRGSVRVVGC